MEAVATHAAFRNRLRQRKRLRDWGLATVKCSIEARDLRQVRRAGEQRPDRGEVVGLVQGREGNVLLERGEHRRVDADGLGELETPVHHAVADGYQSVQGELLAQERHQVVECAVMAELRALAPGALGEHLAARVLRDKSGCRVETLGLPARDEVKIVSRGGEQRELEARRAGVDNRDRLHGITLQNSAGTMSTNRIFTIVMPGKIIA